MNFQNMFKRLLFYKVFGRLPIWLIFFIALFWGFFSNSAHAQVAVEVDMTDYIGGVDYSSSSEFSDDYLGVSNKDPNKGSDMWMGQLPVSGYGSIFYGNPDKIRWVASFKKIESLTFEPHDQSGYLMPWMRYFSYPEYCQSTYCPTLSYGLIIQCYEADNETPCNDISLAQGSYVPWGSSHYAFLAQTGTSSNHGFIHTNQISSELLAGGYEFDSSKIYRIGLIPQVYGAMLNSLPPSVYYIWDTSYPNTYTAQIVRLDTSDPSPFFPDNFDPDFVPRPSWEFSLIVDSDDPDDWQVFPQSFPDPALNSRPQPLFGVIFTRPFSPYQYSDIVRFSGTYIPSQQDIYEWDNIVMYFGSDSDIPFEIDLDDECTPVQDGFANGMPVWYIGTGCDTVLLPISPDSPPFDFDFQLRFPAEDMNTTVRYIAELYSSTTDEHMILNSVGYETLIAEPNNYGNLIFGDGTGNPFPDSPEDNFLDACSFEGSSFLEVVRGIPNCVVNFFLWLITPTKSISDYFAIFVDFFNDFLKNPDYLIGSLINIPFAVWDIISNVQTDGSITPVTWSIMGNQVQLFNQSTIDTIGLQYPWFKTAQYWVLIIGMLVYLANAWQRILYLNAWTGSEPVSITRG